MILLTLQDPQPSIPYPVIMAVAAFLKRDEISCDCGAMARRDCGEFYECECGLVW